MPIFGDFEDPLDEPLPPPRPWIADLPQEINRLARPPESLALAKLDELLSTLQLIVPVAAQLDLLYQSHWHHLERLITEARSLLRVRYTDAPLWEDAPLPSGKGIKFKVTEYPRYTSLVSVPAPAAGNRVLPLKALLLVAEHADFEFQEKSTADRIQWLFDPDIIKDVADKLRLCSKADWQHFHLLLENVPEWTGESIGAWKEAFKRNVDKLPTYKWRSPYPSKHDYLFTLRRVLNHVALPLNGEAELSSPNTYSESTSTETEPSTNSVVRSTTAESQFNPITGHEIRTKPDFHSYSWQRPTTEDTPEAEAPEIRPVSTQEGVETDEPEKAQAVAALEVRYTNYRTAMDNQRLPWAWDCCNPLEVRSLVRSLFVASHVANKDDSRGVLLVWLTLLTGQPLAEILNLTVDSLVTQDDCDGLIDGRYWRRHIPCPRQAYAPKPHHVEHLCANTSTIDFELPEPVIRLTATHGLQQLSPNHGRNIIRLGSCLGVDSKTADALVRKVLKVFRGRDLRFLLGRVRKVLGREIMCVSQNHVLTHLITALKTDAPPSGVYYSSFPTERLQAIYNEAANRIIRGTK